MNRESLELWFQPAVHANVLVLYVQQKWNTHLEMERCLEKTWEYYVWCVIMNGYLLTYKLYKHSYSDSKISRLKTLCVLLIICVPSREEIEGHKAMIWAAVILNIWLMSEI